MFPINFNFPYRKKDGSVITMEKALDGAGADLDLIDLDDVAIETPAGGQLFEYDGTTEKWKNSSNIPDKLNDEIETRAKLGAFNLIPYPYAHGDSRTTGGVVFTVNKKGVINVSTTSDDPDGWYTLATGLKLSDTALEIGETYIFSGGLSDSISLNLYYIDADNQQIGDIVSSTGTEVITTVPSGTDTIGIALHVNAAVSTAQDVYPLLKRESDAYTGFESYAMTNRQLTEYATLKTYRDSTTGARFTKIGRVCLLDLESTGGYTFTASADAKIIDIPSDFLPLYGTNISFKDVLNGKRLFARNDNTGSGIYTNDDLSSVVLRGSYMYITNS